MFLKILIISIIGGIFSLDRVLIQTMISRPIIIAPVIGLILGSPYEGLIIGAILELFWIDRIPVGIYVPPNDSIAAALAASMAILTGQATGEITRELIALSILLAIPFGIVAKKIDVRMMESNNFLSDQALLAAKKLDIDAIERATYLGLAKLAMFYIVVLFILQLILIPALINIYPKAPIQVKDMLILSYYFLPFLGVAVAINTIKLRGTIPVFCVLFLMVAVVVEFFHAF